MQVYNNSNSIGIKTLLLFAAALFIAYLPIASFSFFIKNDAFNGYFPPRFFMSESIHEGHLPLWNPYINFGFPQYGDMSGGFWSPFTWIIASTVGYNAYTFTIEILLYILAGGLGMYKASGLFIKNRSVSIIAGISFMCCGFNVGHLQHVNWLSGIAMLIWCFYFYMRFQEKFSYPRLIVAVLFFYLFVSAAHPTLIISAAYFFLALAVFIFITTPKPEKYLSFTRKFLATHAFMLLLFLLTATGMIIGYLDILPHFVRGQKIDLNTSLENSVQIKSWISVILPFSTVKDDALTLTDPSMRNNYMGLVVLVFLIAGIFSRKTKWQWFLLITGAAFMLLSAGGIFKTVAFYILPLMSYVRLNGIFNAISIICFILFSVTELSKYADRHNFNMVLLKRIILILTVVVAAFTVFGLWNMVMGRSVFLSAFNEVNATSVSGRIKSFIDGITWYDTLWMQGILQMIFLFLILKFLKQNRLKMIVYLCIAELALASLLNIPFTGAGKASLKEVQAVLNLSPQGIPVPKLQPISRNDTMNATANGLTGHWSMYSKQPGVVREVPYPITLSHAAKYFNSIRSNPVISQMDREFIYGDPAMVKIENIISYTPDKIKVRLSATDSSHIIIQQNCYPHWKYVINDLENPVERSGINFMSIPVSKDTKEVTISFRPEWVITGMIISLISLLILLLLIIYLQIKKVR